jgi:uncharacterized protein YjbI with pentapeptide repeats
VEETLREAHRRNISLAGADLTGLTLQNCFIDDLDLSGCDLSNTRINKCNFRGTKLLGVTIDNTLIEASNFDAIWMTLHNKEGVLIKMAFAKMVSDPSYVFFKENPDHQWSKTFNKAKKWFK